MEALINECRNNEKEVFTYILRSIGTRYCVVYNKYCSFVDRVCNVIDDLEILSIYYYIIGVVNLHYLANNNSSHKDDEDIDLIRKRFKDFSEEEKDIGRTFINEFFNDEYKAYFKELGLGGDQK